MHPRNETGEPPPKDKVPPDKVANQQTKNETSVNKKVNLYTKNDTNTTFLVMIEASEELEKNVGKFSHLKIAKEIFELNLKDVIKIKIKGRNRLGIEFANYTAANEFIGNKILRDKGYNLFIPYNQISCKGIIRNIDTQFTAEEIYNMTVSPVKISNILRLNRKVFNRDGKAEYIPTQTVLFTFEGINLPRQITLYSLPFAVSPYISPVTQCYNCLLFGHTSKQCRSKQKCSNCGMVIETEETEKKNEEALDEENTPNEDRHKACKTCCYYCKSNDHKSTAKACPEYQRQVSIKRLMAWDNLSYFDASQLCKKNYLNTNSESTIIDPRDFPTLRSQNKNQQNITGVHQRRTSYLETNNKTKRSYGHVASSSPKRRVALNNSSGYDKDLHESLLYFPNSRPQKQVKINSEENTRTPCTSSIVKPVSATEKITNVETIYKSFNNLTGDDKLKVKDLIINHFARVGTADYDNPMDSGGNSDEDMF